VEEPLVIAPIATQGTRNVRQALILAAGSGGSTLPVLRTRVTVGHLGGPACQALSRVLDMGPTPGQDRSDELFRDQFVLSLKEVLRAFATATPGFDHDKRSRWAYAFNPTPDGDPEKPVYATMAALRAPNFAALRIGVTEGGQVVVEVEHRKLVTPFITNDVENPTEFPKIQRGFRKIIEHFERMAGIARHRLLDRFVADPDYRELAERRLNDTRPDQR
jgi:hypothetical protein